MNRLKFGTADVSAITLLSTTDQALTVKWFSAEGSLLGENDLRVKADVHYQLVPMGNAAYYDISQRVMPRAAS